MNIKVTSRGVTIPRRLLGEATEVEVRREEGRIIVVPVAEKADLKDEPLYELGSDPEEFGITDASVNHDKYLHEDRG